jgi:hypothetical protein
MGRDRSDSPPQRRKQSSYGHDRDYDQRKSSRRDDSTRDYEREKDRERERDSDGRRKRGRSRSRTPTREIDRSHRGDRDRKHESRRSRSASPVRGDKKCVSYCYTRAVPLTANQEEAGALCRAQKPESREKATSGRGGGPSGR